MAPGDQSVDRRSLDDSEPPLPCEAATWGRSAHGVEPEAAQYDAWIVDGQVYVYVLGTISQMTAGSDYAYHKAEIRSGQISIVRTERQTKKLERISTPLAGRYPRLAGVDVVEYSDNYGQSNSAANAAGPLLTPKPFADRFLMFSSGQRAYGNAVGHTQLKTKPIQPTYDAIHDFALGCEQAVGDTTETSNSGFAYGVLKHKRVDRNVAVLTTCSGMGSADINQLKRNSLQAINPGNAPGDPWRMLESKFVRAALFWRLQGMSFVAGPLRWNQGEGDLRHDKATHLAKLVGIRDDWQNLSLAWNALRTTGGHPGKAPIIVTQTCSGARYEMPKSEVPHAQLQINLDDPASALCCGPVYDQLCAKDGAHLLALSQEMQGARQAVAYGEWLDGELWRPLCVRKDPGFAPSRSGAIVTLRLWNHFDLPLLFDVKTIVGLGRDQGFGWADDGVGEPITVVDATIVDRTTVTLTLSGVPNGANAVVEVACNGVSRASAGPATGNRSTLRTDGSRVRTRSGRPVEHFVAIDRVPVV